MIVTICGLPGSGKGTVSTILAQKLGLEHISIGKLRREEAKKRNMTLSEFNAWSEQHNMGDTYFDELQSDLGKKKDNVIFDGRTSFHFIPHSIKIFLSVSPSEGARRIFEDSRPTEHFRSVDEAQIAIEKRLESDRKRYKALYDIQVYDVADFDIVIDTTDIPAQKVAEDIIQIIEKGL